MQPLPNELPALVPSMRWLGERALLLEWPERIELQLNAAVHACAAQLRAGAPDWLEDVVPAYASLLLVVDPRRCLLQRLTRSALQQWVAERLSADLPHAVAAPRTVEIEVHYGGVDGPDLDAVAAAAGRSATEVVALHCGADYRVAMLGFAPGFPYLLGLDPRLAVPRLATPRARVPAGSVGIGGAQTGVYPRQSPGGWQLIGRTRAVLFDPLRDPPSLLMPGDRVRFVAIGGASR